MCDECLARQLATGCRYAEDDDGLPIECPVCGPRARARAPKPASVNQLKAAGLASSDASADEWFRDCADRAIEQLARRGAEFQAHDIVALLGVPEPRHPNAWGARFSAAARRGVIEQAGYAPSSRPTVAGSAVRLWRGTPAWRQSVRRTALTGGRG